MTATLQAPSSTDDLAQTPAKYHPARWRLHRGGLLDVWYYYDAEFTFSGGRVIWRGANGAGKSRALEMLLPYLLDADRTKIGAATGNRVRLDDLMRTGATDRAIRTGYLWLELAGVDDDGNPDHLTLGAFIRFSKSTAEAKVWYFTTPLRVGTELVLLDRTRQVLSREHLGALIGTDRITESPETHRERVRTQVFGLTGDAGRERYAALIDLLHVLRNPDVGNRVEAGKLPEILSDALPPLSEAALLAAGERLDALTETRAAQRRLETAASHVTAFLDTYRRYAVGVLGTVAGAAAAAAATARRTAGEAAAAERDRARLRSEDDQARTDVERLDSRDRELGATIGGIRASREFTELRELDESERLASALGNAADSALQAAQLARDGESRRVAEADTRADDVVDATDRAASTLAVARSHLYSAGMPDLLTHAAAVVTNPALVSEAVRLTRNDIPVPVPRPTPKTLTTTPVNPRTAADQASKVRHAAEIRARQAGNHLATAGQLQSQRDEVRRTEESADQADERASTTRAQANDAATARDRAAAALAAGWRAWIAEAATADLLGAVDWMQTPAGPLLHDLHALAGDGTGDGDEAVLAALDRAADRATDRARQQLADARARIGAAQEAAALRRGDLDSQADALGKARDPEPPAAPWHTRTCGIPLWRAVDFAEHLTEADRAGVEGALLAAGLLTATLAPDATLTAADGEVLLGATGPVARRSLSAVLVADPSCPHGASVITAVLNRVAVDDRTHPIWVRTNGSWGNGPLTGHHEVGAARHIGAQARAAARAERLAAIAAELAELDVAVGDRASELARLADLSGAIDVHLMTAPRSAELNLARDRAHRAADRADAEATEAHRLRHKANALAREWHAAQQRHAEACAAFALPTAADGLAGVQHAAQDATRTCAELARELTDLAVRLGRHAAVLGTLDDEARIRAEAEDAAERACTVWQEQAAELAAKKTIIGVDADRVREQLRRSETEQDNVQRELTRARKRERTLGEKLAATGEKVNQAATAAAAARQALAGEITSLRHVVTLPGVTAAAFTAGRPVPALPDPDPVAVDPAAVEAAVKAVIAAIDGRGGPVDENALIRAQSALEREVSGTFDVLASIDERVRLVELADANGRRPVAAAAAELDRKVAEGQAALTEREGSIFTDFVLGGVTEELRRRLTQAQALIRAMNESLSAIRTSHGIGVKVNWLLAVEHGSPLARIRELVTTADEVRTPEQTEELIGLVKARVAERFAADATAGYAEHLEAALDYRRWHEVEVVILGPAPGQQRRISRRTKLSQGETRFVSYVALFAAADAYLSGLPDTSRSLRLILLDDAFAKVDNRTIALLMGLLVRLDIDFALTGHALWGCYPQVPALDVYEVHRREGSAAITTHIHWDGHTRHLRAAS